tara:strand:- start:753 stop:2615 length:1863 start_codon:yes stop_codon:yes gene_type:complete
MKLNNLQKNFYIFFSVIISILIAAILWEKINLPFNNKIGAKGFLVTQEYNPFNDTVRYIFFILLPLIVFFILNKTLKNQTINFEKLIFESNIKKINDRDPYIFIIFFIFIFFILLEFFSINFIFSNYKIDHFHDGNYLTPVQNYISTKKIWTGSQLTHGLSDMFYPLFVWKIFGIESIGAARSFTIFLVLFLKIFSILLSYQLTKITKLNRESKIIFFTLFSSIIIFMSKYTYLGPSYYISHKDIYIILFLIFFIELFINSKFRNLSLIIICLISTFALLFQIDKGFYINFVLFFYFIYLIITKKYKDCLLIIFSLFIFWTIVIGLVSFEEFKAFLNNSKTIILSMDLMHGLKYPEPFFSMGINSDGARATKGLLLQLTACLFVLNFLFSDINKISNSKKMLFIFLILLSLIMYKNALGRSDGPHIRDSNDLPMLINVFFILNYLLIYFKKKIFINKLLSNKNFFIIPLLYLFIYFSVNHNNYNINNIKNYKSNFVNFINIKDHKYLNQKNLKLINYYKEILKNQNCVENITFEDAVPYLLKKPSCTKYWASWLASPTNTQKDYINEIKNVNPKYVFYTTDLLKFDGLGVYERIGLVDSYIMANYEKYDEIDGYIILRKK